MFQYGYLMISLAIGTIVVTASINSVSARFCEGGHRCSPPKECCAQGCCYLYAPPSAPRAPPPNNTSHVLNLFFINHWFFWCIIFAIIIAILCACSLWKKRRLICGWGSPRPHSQSGDSAGSCYAPPQYSRCSSFHHAPPPYTEVTSKPDLYPLVFTCNADNGKSGASYLMVQYFRNYIVRPVGSLSATSTVDSLSSSFICNANEANTLIPPPYSRAASPDLPITIQDYSSIPRSASQQACSDQYQQQQQQQQQHQHHPSYRPIPVLMTKSNNDDQITLYRHQFSDVVVGNAEDDGNDEAGGGGGGGVGFSQFRRIPNSVSFQRLHSSSSTNDITNSTILNSTLVHNNGCSIVHQSNSNNNKMNNNNSSSNNNNNLNINSDNATRLLMNMSHSDQQFRYVINKNNSNLSIPNSCDVIVNAQKQQQQEQQNGRQQQQQHTNTSDKTIAHESSNGTNNNKITLNNNKKPNLHYSNSTNGIYDSCASIDDNDCGIAMSVPSSTTMITTPTEKPNREFKDLNGMRRSLDVSCPMIDQQQQNISNGLPLSEESPVNADILKKYGNMRGYIDSVTGSAVSSLANIDSPASPPQATSPTGEIRELLEQIRQLQQNANSRDDFMSHGLQSGAATNTLSNDSSSGGGGDAYDGDESSTSIGMLNAMQSKKRPSSLQQNRRPQHRTRFFPISAAKNLRSPIGSTGLLSFGRGRKGWISKSAPTTPGAAMPSCFLDDDSPLLNEHDEDAEHNT